MAETEKAAEYTFDAISAAKKGMEKMPASRERALALTKLEEAAMWFQRAIPPSNETHPKGSA